MNENINKFHYSDSLEDKKLKSFIFNSEPMDRRMDLEAIKQRTYQKRYLIQLRRRKIIRMAVSIAVAASVVLLFLFTPMKRMISTSDSEAGGEMVAETLDTLQVPAKQKMTLLLSDGTKITANSNTTVVYPKQFTGKQREVSIKGEAFFDVTHDIQHPFIVHAQGLSVRVLGTKFNVCNYSASMTDVVLAEGTIEMKLSDTGVIRMKPNQRAVVCNGELKDFKEVDASDYTSWIQDIIILHGEYLGDVVERLNNYYGTSVGVSGVGKRRLYGKLVLQPNVVSVLQSINAISGTHTQYRGRQIIVER